MRIGADGGKSSRGGCARVLLRFAWPGRACTVLGRCAMGAVCGVMLGSVWCIWGVCVCVSLVSPSSISPRVLVVLVLSSAWMGVVCACVGGCLCLLPSAPPPPRLRLPSPLPLALPSSSLSLSSPLLFSFSPLVYLFRVFNSPSVLSRAPPICPISRATTPKKKARALTLQASTQLWSVSL